MGKYLVKARLKQKKKSRTNFCISMQNVIGFRWLYHSNFAECKTLIVPGLVPHLVFRSPQEVAQNSRISDIFESPLLSRHLINSFLLFCTFLLTFIECYLFLCCLPCLSSRYPCSQVTQEILSFSTFYFPYRLDLCKSLLVSTMLSKFSGIVVYRLAFFALCLKTTYE